MAVSLASSSGRVQSSWSRARVPLSALRIDFTSVAGASAGLTGCTGTIAYFQAPLAMRDVLAEVNSG